MIRITVDFNTLTIDRSRVWIGWEGGFRDLEHLKAGERIIVYEENQMQVEAIVEIVTDDRYGTQWYAILDWDTLCDL